MTPVPSSRRIRRRRVTDEDRKRAPRACTRCKARKSKCIETASGICQRSLQGSHTCSFVTQRSSTSPGVLQSPIRDYDESSADLGPRSSPGALADVPDNIQTSRRDLCSDSDAPENFMWPRFLSRLRTVFYLEPNSSPAEREIARLEARSSRTTTSHQSAEALRLQAATESLPPRSLAIFLSKLSIQHGTDCFFYFDQPSFLAVEEFYSDLSSPLRRDPSFLCLLLPRARPSALSGSLPAPTDDPGRVFCGHARILMADTMDRVSMYSVKTAFVLGIYLMPSSAVGASYLYMGLALRKALALGLHHESEEPEIDSHEREMRRRLWWAIYSLERTLTIKLNRPRSISQDVITAHLPQRRATDALQSFDNLDHQVANARFVKIIDTLIEPATWSSNSQPPLQDFEVSLKACKRSLPPNLRLSTVEPRSPYYRAVFHLYLNYYFAWIAIGKTSVVSKIRSHLRSAASGIPEPQSTEDDDVTRQFKSCGIAAKKMLNILEDASNSGMAPSSFTDFQGCSIATIIVVLTGILERDSAYEARVAFGLRCLRRMADLHMAGRLAVRFVEALISIAEEARAKTTQTAGDQNDPSPMWEEAAALLQLRNPSTPNQTLAVEDTALSTSAAGLPEESPFDLGLDTDFPAATFAENHMQLMGLTVMDMLDFTFDI
ncbi:fungal-specific transcription factor domain-containing protein [Colletotrichum phormii]|uniref:Fungal-specific transcription factor domain-containing protein n=1 Tax=Colletotrichum phormii TaxID=359342 RepID=A0AAJ0A5H3_9PEZI|nr:fungal-specific transcription factor domain-containing protein [Colletotrichum phormii]KAK1655436.1 fungal-specific transcription factor domain-containing protein [Colletotrichum phormii]